jgi:8-oxo-dGTP pyrophosphatase MutT (NUDIX family)
MDEHSLPKWKTIKSDYVVKDRWLKLRADTCVTPDGHTISPWYVTECTDWVNYLAVDKEANAILLHHYRHGIDDYVTEIPAGTVETTDDSPEAAMARELAEEIGYKRGEIYRTASSFANPSSQTNRVFSFVARGRLRGARCAV